MAKTINLSRFNNVSVDSGICEHDLGQGRFCTVIGSDPNNRELLKVLPYADYSRGDVVYHASNELTHENYELNFYNRHQFYVPADKPGRFYNLTSGQRASYPAEAFLGKEPSGGEIVIPIDQNDNYDRLAPDLKFADEIPTQPGRIYGIVLEAEEKDYMKGRMYIVRFARVIA